MTATQAPTPGPLTASDIAHVRDYWLAICDSDWHLIPADIRDDLEERLAAVGLAEWRAVTDDDLEDTFAYERGIEKGRSCLDLTALGHLAFRSDADGWMPWSGGEKAPVDGSVELKFRDGEVRSDLRPVACDWLHSPSRTAPDDIIAFRLAPTAPVEASGSELHPATADLVDRFAAELKSKLAKAESRYGYRDEWLKPDWQDELTKSLAEHIQKGDPRDVAAYCAFAWHHEWSVTPNINWKAEWEAVCSARIADRDRSQEIINERDAWIAELLQQAKVTTPARAEAQDEDMACTDCGDTGVTHQTERRCSCQKAEAQDEGAAGEPVAWGLVRQAHEILKSGKPPFSAREVNARGKLRDALNAKPAHPSPTPAADADRVRIAVEALELAGIRFDEIHEAAEVDDVAYRNEATIHGINANADVARSEVREALAALKSTAAKEGGEL